MTYQISLALLEFSSVLLLDFFCFLGLRVHILFDYFVGTVSISRRLSSVGYLVLQKGFLSC
jgi:hypothetical protein